MPSHNPGDARLVLLRHGQSVYNRDNRFTGWTDVDLSPQGMEEARAAGRMLHRQGIVPDVCFASWLKRAVHTAQLALAEAQSEHIDCRKSWELNERHYGAWQGRDKDEVRREVGEAAFAAVRRGYAARPPLLEPGDARDAAQEPRYRALSPWRPPLGESLADTRQRVLHCYLHTVVPELAEGKTVLVSAHGNSLRALVMTLEGIAPEAVGTLEIPTGVPLLYTFDEGLNARGKEVLGT